MHDEEKKERELNNITDPILPVAHDNTNSTAKGTTTTTHAGEGERRIPACCNFTWAVCFVFFFKSAFSEATTTSSAHIAVRKKV